MRRRPFLAGTAAALASLTSRVWAVPDAPAQLLLVFLRGGYDALSLLVPRSGFYREVRPHIAVADAVPIDADWSLHPVLTPSLLPLVRAGQVRFVPFAGTDDLSRSHFETQDSIELGLPLGGRRDHASGFLNRLAAQIGSSGPHTGPIAFTDQLPMALRGGVEVANVSLQQIGGRRGTDRLQPAIASMYRGHPMQERVDEAFALRDQITRDMADEMEASGRLAISAGGFELEARRVARVMRDGHALGFIDIGGWDTHVGQGAATGTLATRLGELGRGLAAFADGLGPAAWQRTVVVVISEFGRTVRENGARGTDHGHGSVYLMLGGALTGRTVAGEQLVVAPSTLFQNRDLPVLNDYRALIGGLVGRQFGLSAKSLEAVFPGSTPRDLGLL